MKSSNSNYQRINDAIEDFAIIIAKAVEEKEFREFLKAEAMKKFDGDYDILYSLVKDKTTKSGKTLHSKVTEIAADVKRAGASKFKSEFSTVEELIAKIPKLQIAIPVNCEKWNTDNFIPPVACLNSELKNKAVTHVKAYDSKGNIVMLEKKNKPDYPVIVISINERLDENGKVRECYLKKNTTLNKTVYEPNIVSRKRSHYENEKLFQSDSGGGDPPPDPPPGGTTTYKLMLWEFCLTPAGISYFQEGNGWIEGDPEFYFDIWNANYSPWLYKGRQYVEIDDDPHCYVKSDEFFCLTNTTGTFTVGLKLGEEDGGFLEGDEEMETTWTQRNTSNSGPALPFNVSNAWYDGGNSYVNIRLNWISY